MTGPVNPALLAMLPPEVRTALQEGAAPDQLMQSMLLARMQAAEALEAEATEIEDELDRDEEPWTAGGGPARAWAPEPVVAPEPDPVRAALARALGACPVCVGGDAGCPVCAGSGTPGWAVPDPDLFAAYVAPALRRLQGEALRAAQAAAWRFSNFPSDPNHTNGTRHQEDGHAR